MNEFEKESATMDMKEEMMSDAVDDVMDDEAEGEGEEEEGDKVLREVLDEIGVSMGQMVSRNIGYIEVTVKLTDCLHLESAWRNAGSCSVRANDTIEQASCRGGARRRSRADKWGIQIDTGRSFWRWWWCSSVR